MDVQLNDRCPKSPFSNTGDGPALQPAGLFQAGFFGHPSAPAMMPELDPKNIAAQLCQFARTNFVAEGTEFDENSPLAQAGVDSFALVELLLFCERVIGVRVPDSHLTGNNLTSMATLANCIAELARNQAPT
jgi:acyl carrier protein